MKETVLEDLGKKWRNYSKSKSTLKFCNLKIACNAFLTNLQVCLATFGVGQESHTRWSWRSHQIWRCIWGPEIQLHSNNRSCCQTEYTARRSHTGWWHSSLLLYRHLSIEFKWRKMSFFKQRKRHKTATRKPWCCIFVPHNGRLDSKYFTTILLVLSWWQNHFRLSDSSILVNALLNSMYTQQNYAC